MQSILHALQNLVMTDIKEYTIDKEIDNMFSMFLPSLIINLLAFYHECHSLISYVTHYLFCDSDEQNDSHFLAFSKCL